MHNVGFLMTRLKYKFDLICFESVWGSPASDIHLKMHQAFLQMSNFIIRMKTDMYECMSTMFDNKLFISN